MSFFKPVLQALWVASLSALCVTSHAQSDWPKTKPVTLLVAFAPGSSTDIVARALTQKLSELTGGNFIVENKGGAGGNIATLQVKRAPADGYTVLVHSVAYSVNPSLYADAGYDALKDFVPVALGPKTPNIITVNPSVNVKNLPELVELARKTPMSYASSGIGTTTHLSMERLKSEAKVDITHVPYQPAAAINAVVASHTPMASTSMPPAVPMVKTGRLKALAVTSATRSPLLPDVPSITEFGYKTSTTTPGLVSLCLRAHPRPSWTNSTRPSTKRWSLPMWWSVSTNWAWPARATRPANLPPSCDPKCPSGLRWSSPRAPKPIEIALRNSIKKGSA